MKKRMEDGVVLGCGRIYGYKVVDGKLEVVPEEAEIVKEIFRSYLYDRKGSSVIAHELSDRGIPTLKNRVWSPQHVLKILKNEKYVGDLTQWKVYTPNVLAEKAKINRGDNPEAPLITIRDHHEGIISREMWDATLAEMFRRSQKSREGRKHSRTYWFSGKLVCGKCGYSYIVSGSTTNPHRQLGCRNRQIYGNELKTLQTTILSAVIITLLMREFWLKLCRFCWQMYRFFGRNWKAKCSKKFRLSKTFGKRLIQVRCKQKLKI